MSDDWISLRTKSRNVTPCLAPGTSFSSDISKQSETNVGLQVHVSTLKRTQNSRDVFLRIEVKMTFNALEKRQA